MNPDPAYMEAIGNVATNEEKARDFAFSVMLAHEHKQHNEQNADTDQFTMLDVANIEEIVKLIMTLAISNNEDELKVIDDTHRARTMIDDTAIVREGPPPVQRSGTVRAPSALPGVGGRACKFLRLPPDV